MKEGVYMLKLATVDYTGIIKQFHGMYREGKKNSRERQKEKKGSVGTHTYCMYYTYGV